MRFAPMAWIFAVLLIIGGCAAPRSIMGGGRIVLKTEVVKPITQAVVTPYEQTNIHHLDLVLYPLSEGIEGTAIASRSLLNAQLNNPIVFSTLKAKSQYRVKAQAYDASNQIISTQDSNSWLDLEVLSDDRPTLGSLKVRLADRAFNGIATSSLNITAGGYALSGPESMAYALLVRTLAGGNTNDDGIGTEALFYSPSGVAVDGGKLYIADSTNHLIRAIDIATKEVTTLAGSTKGFVDASGTAAQFNNPLAVAVDGGTLYVADTDNHKIRAIDLATKAVTTLAGSTGGFLDATGTAARFNKPKGLAVSGGILYVADSDNQKIRAIDLATKAVTTLAGSTSGYLDATGTGAQFSSPCGVAVDSGMLYVSDQNHKIRAIDLSTKDVTTLAGSVSGSWDGTGTAARFYNPYGVTVSAGTLYVGDYNNHRIRAINLSTKAVTTLAGSTQGSLDASGTAAKFDAPYGVAVDGGTLYVADSGNHKIRAIDIAGKAVTTLAGKGSPLCRDALGKEARLSGPSGVAVDGGTLYVADTSNHKIRVIDLATMAVTTLAGSTQGFLNATGTAAKFDAPYGVAVDGGTLYVADANNNKIRAINLATKAVTTLAGSSQGFLDATGTAAKFCLPKDLTVSSGTLYVADTSNNRIRAIDIATKAVTTLAGSTGGFLDATGTAAKFSSPSRVAVDGGVLYVTDSGNHKIRAIDLATKAVTTLAGSTGGFLDGGLATAQFYNPRGITVNNGKIYISDNGNKRIRILD